MCFPDFSFIKFLFFLLISDISNKSHLIFRGAFSYLNNFFFVADRSAFNHVKDISIKAKSFCSLIKEMLGTIIAKLKMMLIMKLKYFFCETLVISPKTLDIFCNFVMLSLKQLDVFIGMVA